MQIESHKGSFEENTVDEGQVQFEGTSDGLG